MEEDRKEARRSIWRQRGRRFATGLNVAVSLLLALVVLSMVNYLSYRHYHRWDIGQRAYYRLSGKTKNLLSSLDTNVNVVAFFQKDHKLCEDVRNLLKEYEYETARTPRRMLKIEFVDPDRDLARTRQLKQKYDVLKEPNVVVFEASGRKKYVEARDLADYDYSPKPKGGLDVRMIGFRGEQAFSSAIHSVAQPSRPVVYFLIGHGERDPEDYDKQSGYSGIARTMRRDNMEVKTLQIGEQRTVPPDCSAIVVAGPNKRLSDAEIDILANYLDRNGRIFFLVDPGVTSGLEKLLENWGVRLGQGVVVGETLSGRDLVVHSYGEHPITKYIGKTVTMFYMPRAVEPLAAQTKTPDVLADKPRVTALAFNTDQGWEEFKPAENPPKYEPGVDRPGPVSVAAAVEKGTVKGIEVEIKSTRIVVIGDSYFVSNGALGGAAVGGNVTFFLSAMNWLLEREALMGIQPKVPGELHLDMTQNQKKMLFLMVAGVVPGIFALIGVIVWSRRRY